QTLTATRIMQDIWTLGLAERQDNPYDEAIEKKWSTTWLFYANTIRFASSMAGGGDYGVFAGGRYQLSQTLLELNDWLKLHQKLDAASKK
ncbi:MAG: hydroxylamine oxidase, partial [Desulfobacterales bacterium]